MPEDTRVQQQVHMPIWMEADIIMVIVSDARRAVKLTLDFLRRKFWMQRFKKSTDRDAWFSARGMAKMSNQGRFGESGAIRHQNTIPS